ncbi:MAG: hypothetical protein J2O48_05550 [Solirubrobacterales bacterium]|nr:hypothetical protein [Solirubrobacterales bacterium]
MRLPKRFLAVPTALLAFFAAAQAGAHAQKPVAVAAYGDSWTKVSVGGQDWEAYLQSLLPKGSSVADRGVYSEDSGNIGFREGGIKLALSSPVTLHAGSSAPVKIAVKAPITFNEYQDAMPASLGNVYGSVQFGTWSGGQFSPVSGGHPAGRVLTAAFTPAHAPSKNTSMGAGTQLGSPTARPDAHKVQILWQGGNDEDLPDNSKLAVKGTLEATRAEVQHLSAVHNHRFLVLSVLVNEYEVPALKGRTPMHLQWIHEINAGLKQAYPNNYVDLTDFLAKHARGIARETGIKLYPQDLKAAAMGVVPDAFTVGDGVHLNAQVRRLVQAPMLASKLRALGWA